MRNCVTHYHACDCREAMFEQMKKERDFYLETLKKIIHVDRFGGVNEYDPIDTIAERAVKRFDSPK